LSKGAGASVNEVVREFLLESDENLAQLDLDLLALEKDPNEKETISRVFRTLHTVKGTAGFLGLEKLQAVSHSAENLLSKVRSGELAFGPPIAAALLAVLDAVREILRRIESEGSEGDRDDAALIALLDSLTKGEDLVERPAKAKLKTPDADPRLSATSSSVSTAENLAATICLPEGAELPTESPPPAPVPPASPPAATVDFQSNVEGPVEGQVQLSLGVADSAIRVNVSLLDKLMNIVGELVLTRNQLLRHTSASEDDVLLGTVQRLNLLTTELQAGVMKTRMQPVGAVWSKFPRLVRDLAVACGKQVRFEMDGQETELDKTILEAIRDPLTHMVRNAVDHGLETPEARVAAGKPVEGSLRLHAFHESGKVVLEVVDDGGGIDAKRIRDKAVRMGIVTEEAARRLTEGETLDLIFKPGFSTTETVTQFSGRGVGMDVVRTNVERMGGTVDLESKLGVGTSIRLRMPLTLAIVPALVVSSAEMRFAIPQVSLLELIRVEGERADLEDVHGAPVYRLRGHLLPLAFLDRELGLNSNLKRSTSDGLLIVVLQADDRQFGLVVDSIHDTEEIVVKPLQRQIKGLNVYAGATIMGDGRVALILDVTGLAKRAGLTIGQSGRTRTTALHSTLGTAQLLVPTLIFKPRAGGRMAMTLDQVARLEEFPRSAIEQIADRLVVQFRGSIMPLVDIAELLSAPRDAARSFNLDDDSFQIVVHEHPKGRIGLLVGRILDIVDEAVAARTPPLRSGVLFNSVVGGFVTEFLDIDEILRRADHLLSPDGERSVA
jgi:two-component system, chemotaxis family, sensor kinase CheA